MRLYLVLTLLLIVVLVAGVAASVKYEWQLVSEPAKRIRTWCNEWGNTASVGGLALALVGIAISAFKSIAAQTAAANAEQAANQARNAVQHVDVIIKLTEAATILDEMRKHYSKENWEEFLECHRAIARPLFACKGPASTLSPADKTEIQGVLRQLSQVSQEIEKAHAEGAKTRTSKERLATILHNQAEKLATLEGTLRI